MKRIYLLWPSEPMPVAAQTSLVLDTLAPPLLEAPVDRLVAYVRDEGSDVPSPSPFRGREPLPFAALDVWCDDETGFAVVDGILRDQPVSASAYAVEESVYRDYGDNPHAAPRDWPDQTRSPGLCTLNLLERPRRLDPETWRQRWFEIMSPVSEAIQPRTRYVRNVVTERLDAEAPPWDGIVVECWPDAKHLRNPFLFYGAGSNPVRLVVNAIRILRAVTSFTAVHRVRVVPMAEVFLRT